ncbi:uncharacterized protein LOC142333944 [Lycorma delicatula]|uniref:uncharacterized protein LOC142333944 n=1 Tax=Lycorma delicatula TaxID=130591 RepID=UPI003F511B8F
MMDNLEDGNISDDKVYDHKNVHFIPKSELRQGKRFYNGEKTRDTFDNNDSESSFSKRKFLEYLHPLTEYEPKIVPGIPDLENIDLSFLRRAGQNVVSSQPAVVSTKETQSFQPSRQPGGTETVVPKKELSSPPEPPAIPCVNRFPVEYPLPVSPSYKEGNYKELWPPSQQPGVISLGFVPPKKTELRSQTEQPGVKIPGFVPPKKPESLPPSQQPGFIIQVIVPPKKPESLPPSQQPGVKILAVDRPKYLEFPSLTLDKFCYNYCISRP